jgi:integral membrane sensor domain MASE1
MSTKQKIISLYFFIAFLFALYGWLFGHLSYRGFAYNLGVGLVWPATIFPAFGAFLGTVIIVLFVITICVLG